jgi:hypothetical protein
MDQAGLALRIGAPDLFLERERRPALRGEPVARRCERVVDDAAVRLERDQLRGTTGW